MAKVVVHKVGSATCRHIAGREVEIGPGREVRPGDVVIVEALEEKRVYDQLELVGGRLAHVSKGDVIAGVIGSRKALRGFVGHAPGAVRVGETLNILNLGGVIGICTSDNKDYGPPLKVKVLGVAMKNGATINIDAGAIAARDDLVCSVPIIVVAGTCMAAGKTRAVCEIIAHLNQAGFRLGALKLSGVAALRDTLNMEDHGAIASMSFLDAGHPSTAGFDDLAPMAKGMISEMAKKKPLDGIVIEMGDGIIGGYGVASFYKDDAIRRSITCHVMCANDLVAAWGAKELSRDVLLRSIDVMSGPATDNAVGEHYVEDQLGIPAANARTSGERLASLVREKCFGEKKP